MIVLTVTPMVSVIWSRNARCTALNGVNVASSMTASTRPSNSTGSTTSSAGGALPEPGGDPHVPGRDVGEVDPAALGRGLADQRLAEREVSARRCRRG